MIARVTGTSSRACSRRRSLFIALVAALAIVTGCDKASPSASADDPLNRGLQARAAGDFDGATQAYFETLAKDPKNKFALFNLGEIAQTQNKLVVAEGFYRMALEQDARFVSPLFNLAIVRTVAGDTKEAVDLYRRAIAVEPNYADAHQNLAVLLQQLGLTVEAQAELATAQRLNPLIGAPNAVPATPKP